MKKEKEEGLLFLRRSRVKLYGMVNSVRNRVMREDGYHSNKELMQMVDSFLLWFTNYDYKEEKKDIEEEDIDEYHRRIVEEDLEQELFEEEYNQKMSDEFNKEDD